MAAPLLFRCSSDVGCQAVIWGVDNGVAQFGVDKVFGDAHNYLLLTISIKMTLTKLSSSTLKSLVEQLHGIKDVEEKNDSILFEYHDKDGDDVGGIFKLASDTQMSGYNVLTLSNDYLIAGMVACAAYNGRPDIHGTYACVNDCSEDGKYWLMLQMDIDISGGVEPENIVNRMQALVDHINLFESKIQNSLTEIGKDSSFLKGGFWDSFLRGIMQGIGQAAAT